MDLAELWTLYADTQFRQYSPLYERIARTVAGSDDVLGLVREAPPGSHLPNVLLAAVHYLLLAGAEHPLGDVYRGTADMDPGRLFVDFCMGHRPVILGLLETRHTNTNEVGRSAVLGPALTAVADRVGSPLGLVDVGCSAGLNLLCDQYRLSYGDAGETGPPDAAIRLDCDVVGEDPPIASQLPMIAARIGLDCDPVDVYDDDDVRWQLACVWPDTDRLPRTRLALEQARHARLHIVRGDAVDSLAGVVQSLPADCVPVVTTTWALAYLVPDRRRDFERMLRRIGDERPVAWISGEGPGVVSPFADVPVPSDDLGMEASVLGLVVFSEAGAEVTLLGFVHPHGNWIDWRNEKLATTST